MQTVLVLIALLLIGYGAYGLLIDDLYIPTKNSPGHHYHGAGAWMIFLMIVSFAALIVTMAFSRYDLTRRCVTTKRLQSGLSVVMIIFMLFGMFIDY